MLSGIGSRAGSLADASREQHLRAGVRQRQEQDHRAVQGLAGEGGFHPHAQPGQERASAGQSSG